MHAELNACMRKRLGACIRILTLAQTRVSMFKSVKTRQRQRLVHQQAQHQKGSSLEILAQLIQMHKQIPACHRFADCVHCAYVPGLQATSLTSFRGLRATSLTSFPTNPGTYVHPWGRHTMDNCKCNEVPVPW